MNELIPRFLRKQSEFGKKAKIAYPQVGRWYVFEAADGYIGYGKVTSILNNNRVEVEKYFELPSYRPYAAHAWYDNLPWAVYDDSDEEDED